MEFEKLILGEWKYPYKVTADGKFFSYTYGRWREIKEKKANGVVKMNLRRPDGSVVGRSKNRMVYEAFHGELPQHLVVVPINNIRGDCRLKNLKVTSRSHLQKSATRGRARPVVQYDEDGVITNSWPSAKAAVKDLYISYSGLLSILHGESKNHLKVAWEKSEDLMLDDMYGYGQRKRARLAKAKKPEEEMV